MKEKPVRPTFRPVPAGFVDAIGLDDDSIPIKPFVVGTRSNGAKTRRELKRPAGKCVKPARRLKASS